MPSKSLELRSLTVAANRPPPLLSIDGQLVEAYHHTNFGASVLCYLWVITGDRRISRLMAEICSNLLVRFILRVC